MNVAAPLRLHPYARYARICAKLVGGSARQSAEEKSRAKSSEAFLKAIRFSRLNVTPFEVEMAAYVGFLVTLVGVAAISFPIATLAGAQGAQLGLFVGAPAGLLALGVLVFLGKFPESHARALRARTAGQMPEAISYLALSMQLNPSLTKAVEFAANHAQEPIAGSLRNVLWRVYVRERPRVEDSFIDFAYEWGDWNEDFKKALYTVRAAELENSAEGREATLDKATASMYKGARAMIEDFALSLGGPTTIFFALGILLPMMLGAGLPILGLGGTSISPVFIVVLFDLVIPLGTLAYAYSILQKRPGTSPPPEIDAALTGKEKASMVAAVLLTVGGSVALGYFALVRPELSFLGYMPFLWAPALGIASWAYFSSQRLKRERDRIRKLETEYPDALYQIGNRMGEGHPVEQAIDKTGRAMKGTEIAKLLSLASYRLQVMKTSLEDTLFGPRGVLSRQPSRVVENTMKVVVGATRKEARAAGRTIVSVSAYLREMLTVEREIQTRLRDVTDTMLTTGVFFAPVVFGVTVALNLIIADTLAGIDTESLSEATKNLLPTGGEEAPALSPQLFGLVIGIYLFFTVMVTTYFVSGIRNGRDRIEWKWMVATTLPGAMVIYTVAALAAQALLG